MNNQKRRPFRSRTNKSNYRGRGGSSRSNNNGHFQNKNGNNNFIRNGSMTNPFNVEKAIQKFQQLAKDAHRSGDPVLIENYLQHAEHYSRRLAEINHKNQPATDTSVKNEEVNLNTESPEDKKI